MTSFREGGTMDRTMREREEESEQRADQWIAGGTIPDADETWSVPPDDLDATWPIRPNE